MDAPRTPLVRALAPSVLAREATDDGPPVMFGHFTRFGSFYEIRSAFEGHFMERTAPGAFRKTIAERADKIPPLFNHGKDPSIGQKVLGEVRVLREDGEGVYYEVELDDTSYVRDLLPGLRRGAYGASFMFTVTDEVWDDEPQRSEHNPQGLPERTITGVKLHEFGPVTFPASDAATSGVRSLTDEFFATSSVADVQAPRAGRADDEAGNNPTSTPGEPHVETYTSGDVATYLRSLSLLEIQ